ncbi:uncharacterized protein LOC144563997 [Carex rostrata]
MGCGSSSHRIVGFSSRSKRNPITESNPDPNPNPVYLCRDRAELIRSACDRRYDAAAAHVTYFRSLSALGESLRQFAAGELSTSAPGSPVLTLPISSKGKSKAGSDLGSDSDSDSSTVTPLSHALSFEDDEEKLNTNTSTVTPLTHDLSVEEKRKEQEPQSNSSRKLEEDSGPPPKSNNMAASNGMPSPTNIYQPYDYDYPYGYGDRYGYGYGYETTNSNPNFDDRPGPSKPATPSMPVQESSAWEFFDPFSNYDEFMERYGNLNSNSNSYLSSPDLTRVRKQEGIPDLEDEINFEEKQKEIKIENEKQREIETETEKQKENEKEKEKEKEKDGKDNGILDPPISVTMENVSISADGSVGKSKDEKSTRTQDSDNGPDMLVAVEIRDLGQVMEEIKEQFDSVADCAKEVADKLEVSKVQHRSGALGAISSRILDPLPILPSSCLPHKHLSRGKTGKASGNSIAGTANGDINGLTPLSLSLTLDKLYVWEKRLYKEVKDEEKLRAEYEKKYRRLKYLDDHGAEHNVIKTTNDAITSLSNRISIVMRSADTISSRIHHIRDEELQPQLIQLVQSLMRMWKSIFDCHNKQLKAIKGLNTRNIKPRIRSDAKQVARFTLRLEKEISRWHHHLEDWIGTQKSFIEALNGYLIRWIRNEPDPLEETVDGVPPFSPARIGAPSSFVISNDWYHGVKKVSETKLLDCIANFKSLVRQYRKLQEDESRYRTKAEYLSMIYDKRLVKSFQEDTGVRIGIANSEIVSLNGKEKLESTETGNHVHDHDHDRHVTQLEALERRRDEEREKQMVALEKLNKMGSVVLITGLVPIFEEFDNFVSNYLKSYETVRMPVQG